MATHQLFIPATALYPGTSGNVFHEPYTIKATNDFFAPLVLIFNDTATKDDSHVAFQVPQNFVSAPKLYPVWTSTATSGNVVWEAAYRAIGGDDSESLDQATAQETLNVTDAAPTAAHNQLKPSMSMTASNLAVGDTIELKLSRDGSSGSDTMAAAVILLGLIFEYADA